MIEVVITAFITMYATKMWFYMDAYQDDYYLLETACLNSPDAWFAWHARAIQRWGNKSYQEAVIIWTMARIISPKQFKINLNLASALAMGGHQKEAEHFLKIAESNMVEGQADAQDLIDKWRKGEWTIVL